MERGCRGLIHNIHNSSDIQAKSPIPYFIICKLCSWCCTLFCFNPNTNYIQKCPCCKNDKLGSSSILLNGTYNFDYTPKATNISEFGPETSDNNGHNITLGAATD